MQCIAIAALCRSKGERHLFDDYFQPFCTVLLDISTPLGLLTASAFFWEHVNKKNNIAIVFMTIFNWKMTGIFNEMPVPAMLEIGMKCACLCIGKI
jgi:hypothetical protein